MRPTLARLEQRPDAAQLRAVMVRRRSVEHPKIGRGSCLSIDTSPIEVASTASGVPRCGQTAARRRPPGRLTVTADGGCPSCRRGRSPSRMGPARVEAAAVDQLDAAGAVGPPYAPAARSRAYEVPDEFRDLLRSLLRAAGRPPSATSRRSSRTTRPSRPRPRTGCRGPTRGHVAVRGGRAAAEPGML
jgi:hypothetical protein